MCTCFYVTETGDDPEFRFRTSHSESFVCRPNDWLIVSALLTVELRENELIIQTE